MEKHDCVCGVDPKLVGDPVDTLTGAVVDNVLEFRLTGPIEIRWTRYYDSSCCDRSYSLGRGSSHEYDRSLTIEADRLVYIEAVRRTLTFPLLAKVGDECALHGFTVWRASNDTYCMFAQGEPAMEFALRPGMRTTRLTRMFRGSCDVRFCYDAMNRLTGINDSAGRHITVKVDSQSRLLRLHVERSTSCAGFPLIAYEYDDSGNLVRTVDTEGNGHTYVYDDANRMIIKEGRKGFRFYFKYDGQGRCVRSMGDDRLFGVALEFAVPGRVTRVTRPDLGIWTYYFTPEGGLQAVLDPLGGTYRFIREPVTRRLLQEIDPNGNLSTIVYDAAGAPLAKIDGWGRRIELPENPNAPDPLARQVPLNAAEYEYGRLLNPESIKLPTAGDADLLGLAKDVMVHVFKGRVSMYPDIGFDVPPLRVNWWPKPAGGRIFNDFGKLKCQRDDADRQRHWRYDASGNVAEYLDFDGGKWEYDYGNYHFLQRLRSPIGSEVHFSYTSYGELASFSDALGSLSSYGYDRKNQLIEVRRHGVLKETYRRDACGNLLAKHGADGRELLRFEVGPGNLPVKRVLASGDEHTFIYDRKGRYRRVATQRDCIEFAYDRIGNCIRELKNGIGVVHKHCGWRRPSESVVLGRFHIRYAWQGNTLIISDPSGVPQTLRLLDHGLVERKLSNGSRETAQYDAQGRCLFKQVDKADGHTWRRVYHWSGESELRGIDDSIRGSIRHEYDAAHRLTARISRDSVEHFDMDLADNLFAQPHLDNVELLEGNRLGSANGEIFRYNDRNSVEFREGPQGTTQYYYDSRDQLVRVEGKAGSWKAEYDVLGRRTRKIWNDQSVEYYWNDDQLIAEIDKQGRLRLYLYFDPLAITPYLMLDYQSVESSPDSCRRYFIYADQIGTPCLLEDDEGKVVWNVDVSPFGNVTQRVIPQVEFNLRFPGHYYDAELGLHYNRSRYYDPTLGRYLQSDPWGISGGHNLYAYRVNPLADVDTLGLGEEANPSCRRREADAEGTGNPDSQPARRMTPEELQSAADYIRHGGEPRPNDWSTLTVTEGMENGRPVHTVTSSRSPSGPGSNLTDGERARAREVFGNDVRTPPPDRSPPGDNTFHAEQRGARATQDQTDRRQASSNQTATTRRDPDVGHMGAACSPCAACQGSATNSQGQPNPIENVTGTVGGGGRTNNPEPGAWRGYS